MKDVIGFDALHKSMQKCIRGVRWKGTVQHIIHNWPDVLGKLSEELENGTYEAKESKFFRITEPKPRDIMSIHIRDRIYQRSLNDERLYPQVAKSLIPDNFACQEGKGTKPARDRFVEFLHKFFRKYGTNGFVLSMDVKGYYPNMDRNIAKNLLSEYMDKEAYEAACSIIDNMPRQSSNVSGFNAGSQIVQILGIMYLDPLDHFIKERLGVKYYIRYQDDLKLIHNDKAFLENCLDRIKEELAKVNLEINEKKTHIEPISKPIKFLGFYFHLLDTGKVLVFVDPKKIKHEKRKLRRMKGLVDKGLRSKWEVDRHFKAYKNSIRYGNSHDLIYDLNRWYEDLWKET